MKLNRIRVVALTAGTLALVGAATLLTLPKAEAQASGASFGPANAKDTYYWVSQNATLPLFVQNDYKGMKRVADDLKIRIRVVGPNTIDLNAFIATVDQVCAQKPAGVSVVGGWDPSLTAAVNRCIERGVPTVVDDGDLIQSKRISYIGTSWTSIGREQAKAMIKALGPKGGKVAFTSIINADNMKEARAAFRAAVEGTNITIVADEDDKGDAATAASVTSSLLAAHPDLAGIAGFDSESGAGIVRALTEAKKVGQVKVTAMEQVPDFIKTIKSGAVEAIMVQKRELMTYYAFKMLYDFKNNGLTVNGLKGFDAVPVPNIVDTGVFVIDKNNVDKVLAALGVK